MSSRKRLFLSFSPFLQSSWRVSLREALSCLASSKRNPMDSSNGFESFDLMLSIDVVTVTTVPVSIGVGGETTNSLGRCSERFFNAGFSKSDKYLGDSSQDHNLGVIH